jgi:hypothetical protein
MEGWRTYTPDGRMLEVEHEGGAWAATCDGVRGTGSTAHAAISEALGPETRSIGTGAVELSEWVDAHAAQLQAEID